VNSTADGEGNDADADGIDTGDATESAEPAGTPGLGRRILLGVGGVVVLLSAGIGWLVGSNGQLSDAAVLGTGITVPVTPAAIALYGVVVSTAILGTLFGLVELVSRREGNRPGRE
jgi:hypothetical protein